MELTPEILTIVNSIKEAEASIYLKTKEVQKIREQISVMKDRETALYNEEIVLESYLDKLYKQLKEIFINEARKGEMNA